MGNGGLTGCSVMDQEAVSVVHPNGYVEYIRKPCNVDELLQGYPNYFLSRSIIAKSGRGLPRHAKLETGQTYFLQPKPGTRGPGTRRILRPIPALGEHAPRVPLTLLQALKGVENQCNTGSVGDRKRRKSSVVHTRYPTSKKGVSSHVFPVQSEELEPGRKVKQSAREIEPKKASYIRSSEYLVKFVFFQDCSPATSRLMSNDHRIRLLEPQRENRSAKIRSSIKQDSHPYSRGSRYYRRSGNKSWQPVLQSISEATPVVLDHKSADHHHDADLTGDVDIIHDSCCTPHELQLSYYVDTPHYRQLDISFEAKCSVYTA